MNEVSVVDALDKSLSTLTENMNTQSAVMEGAAEYVPILPPSDSISNLQKPNNIVLVPEGVKASEEAGRTSIASKMHAARRPKHAVLGNEAAAHLPSKPLAAGGPVLSQPNQHAMDGSLHSAESLPGSILATKKSFVTAKGVCTPASDVAVANVNSSKLVPRENMRNGEGYAQTVLPASDLADKARKDLAFVADVHGACQPVHAELGREVFATPTRTTCPAMNGSMRTPVNPNTSIKPVPNHKGVEMNKIVDFGGIEKETSQNVRSSGRLRAQPNYDATQMERARMLLQKRDELPVIGYPARCSLDSTMGFPSPFGTAGGYGYWMQPDASGCSGLLFPGYWVATH